MCPIIASVETLKNIKQACVALFNYLMKTNNRYVLWSINEVDNAKNEGLCPTARQGSRILTLLAKTTRDQFKGYFSSDAGAWQNKTFNATA